MDQFIEWAFRGVALSLIAAIVALFSRMRAAENKQTEYEQRIKHIEGADHSALADLRADMDSIQKEIHQLQLGIERTFVRREEWVPHISRVLGALEHQGKMIERLDERLSKRS